MLTRFIIFSAPSGAFFYNPSKLINRGMTMEAMMACRPMVKPLMAPSTSPSLMA